MRQKKQNFNQNYFKNRIIFTGVAAMTLRRLAFLSTIIVFCFPSFVLKTKKKIKNFEKISKISKIKIKNTFYKQLLVVKDVVSGWEATVSTHDAQRFSA